MSSTSKLDNLIQVDRDFLCRISAFQRLVSWLQVRWCHMKPTDTSMKILVGWRICSGLVSRVSHSTVTNDPLARDSNFNGLSFSSLFWLLLEFSMNLHG
jgi:hypothetical protein